MPLPVNVSYYTSDSEVLDAALHPRDMRMPTYIADAAPDPPALIFNAYTLGAELRVQWGRLVVDDATVKTAARYTLSGSGSPVVTGVTFHGTYVTLTYSGTLAVGSTYNLTVAAATATANGDLTQNDVGTVSFIGTASTVTPPPALTFVAYTIGSQLRVHWGRPVEDTSQVRDASRYTISGPTAVTVASVSYASTYATLTYSGNFLPGSTYTLTVAAGTATAQEDGAASSLGTSTFRGVDENPPAVTYSPASGTPLDPSSAVGVDVTDSSGLRTVLVTVDFPELKLSEVVHDGVDFKGPYKGLSTFAALSLGHFQYAVRRKGGWPEGPVFHVYAADAAGNEV